MIVHYRRRDRPLAAGLGRVHGAGLSSEPRPSMPPRRRGDLTRLERPGCAGVHRAMDTLQALYESEINFAVLTFWDCGVCWKLGDAVSGYKAEGRAASMAEAADALAIAACRHFPESTFARRRLAA